MRVAIIWMCLLLRLAFYASTLPLWEGVDEWAHVAVVQSVALRGELLGARDRPIPRNIEASLRIAPLPWELRRFDPPSLTHDAWWQLPEAARREREAALHAIPPQWAFEDGSGLFSNYEAQQPPLYYWLVAPAVWLLRGGDLAEQVAAARWVSILLASLIVPLVYSIGREIFDDERLAVGCAAVVAVMPGFAGIAARVGNDGLAAVIFAALLWSGLRACSGQAAWPVAVWFGLGLLTKAYFLTAVPAVLWLLWRRGAWRGVALPLLIAGWWYGRNALTAGSLLTSGSMAGVRVSPRTVLASLPSVPWLRAVDAALFSHIYCLGWSWLTVRSWIYHVFYLAFAAAAVGLWRWRQKAGIQWLLAVYLLFWLGELWHAALMYVARGVAASMGYYLYGVVAAEVPLCVAGLATWLRRWAAPLLAAMFGLLDLAAMHLLALPYYSGSIRHQADGKLHFAHSVSVHVSALWVGYVVATVACVVLSVATGWPGTRRRSRAPA
jgi:4-amino-4-deoxy-L-arabinose transferase-like glycosyltransferase